MNLPNNTSDPKEPYQYSSDLPQWLLLGLTMHALRRGSDTKAWEQAVAKSGVEPRTLIRFARIADFLEKHYPEALLPDGEFVAGSAVMLELMKLHEISRFHAEMEAPATFHGRLSVRDLRGRVEAYREEIASMNATPAKSSQQRTAAFIRNTANRIVSNPSVLTLTDLKRLEVSDARSPLSPKLIAHCDERVIAVDIRAPDVTAARTAAAAAVIYATRIGVLMLRYDAVILVLPENARKYADAIIELLREWSKDPKSLLKNIAIMLAGENELTYVEDPHGTFLQM